uniref:keratin, type II cuticular Hb1-like n=1 Tax=Jaculus jaculus TaxID=51337 RepID=UPI001E1B24C3|nr:keratin, type II cuticular Hb1-like [Jaculus jaculus]
MPSRSSGYNQEFYCEDVKATAQKPMQSLRPNKEVLNRLNQAIRQLRAEVAVADSEPCELEKPKDLEALQAAAASGDAKDKLAWLEATLQRAKQDMAQQLREYQELMIVKLGLDFEIATYRKLLEDKEQRLSTEFGTGSIAQGSSASPSVPVHLQQPGACSGPVGTSAPGGGCTLCSSPGCVGGSGCSGSGRC